LAQRIKLDGSSSSLCLTYSEANMQFFLYFNDCSIFQSWYVRAPKNAARRFRWRRESDFSRNSTVYPTTPCKIASCKLILRSGRSRDDFGGSRNELRRAAFSGESAASTKCPYSLVRTMYLTKVTNFFFPRDEF